MSIRKGDDVWLIHRTGGRLRRTVERVTRAGTIVIRYISGEWHFHPDGSFKCRPASKHGRKDALGVQRLETSTQVDAVDHLESLVHWLHNGGHAPDVSKAIEMFERRTR